MLRGVVPYVKPNVVSSVAAPLWDVAVCCELVSNHTKPTVFVCHYVCHVLVGFVEG